MRRVGEGKKRKGHKGKVGHSGRERGGERQVKAGNEKKCENREKELEMKGIKEGEKEG